MNQKYSYNRIMTLSRQAICNAVVLSLALSTLSTPNGAEAEKGAIIDSRLAVTVSNGGSHTLLGSHGRQLLGNLDCTAYGTDISCSAGQDAYCCNCGTLGCSGTCSVCDGKDGCTQCSTSQPYPACCSTVGSATTLSCNFGASMTCTSPSSAYCCNADTGKFDCQGYTGGRSGSCSSSYSYPACCSSESAPPTPTQTPKATPSGGCDDCNPSSSCFNALTCPSTSSNAATDAAYDATGVEPFIDPYG